MDYFDTINMYVMMAPGLTWQASLKMIEQLLELLTGVDIVTNL